MKSGIYLIQCGDRKYVGQAIDIKQRWREHKSSLNNNKHRNNYLQSVWNKYGEKFQFIIIEKCDESLLNDREIFWINKLNTLNNNNPNGMNFRDGGIGGGRHSLATRIKIGLAGIGRPAWNKGMTGMISPRKGVHLSEETKQKISDAQKNKKPISDETRKKLSLKSKGNTRNKGKKFKESSSVYYGVLITHVGKYTYWRCAIQTRYIGQFKTELEAAIAYDNYVIENNLDRPLNFPDGG